MAQKKLDYILQPGQIGSLTVIGWNFNADVLPLHTPLDLAIQFSWNYWQSCRSIQITLVDWRIRE